MGALGRRRFVVAWLLWLGTSGNSRYFMPMGCVAGVLLAALLQRVYLRWRDATLIVAGVVVLAQGVQFVVATDWKRDGSRGSGPWLTTEFPGRFRDEPFLFLSTSFLAGSAFLPYWHPSSGMMTITGFYAWGRIAPEAPAHRR